MCGIAGVISLNYEPFCGAKPIQLMAQSMVNRGPDDEGFLIANLKTKQIVPAFGATKHNQHGRYWMVYNGEVFNYREISKDLISRGVKLHSQSDTEVILNAYLLWGEQALQRLNGMFALAIFDAKENQMFFARDRIGIKPFYYTLQNNQLIFASDIKTLIASGLYTPEVDLEGLYHAMSYGVAPRPMTSFKDVKALEQAHWMKVGLSSGKIDKQAYWQIPINAQDHSLTLEKSVNLLDEAVHKAVEYQLHSDVPVGTFMSGGIDSTTLSAIAATKHRNIKAFTLGFEGEKAAYLDEVGQAEATAAMYTMQHIVHRQKPETILDEIEQNVRCYEEPFFSLSPNLIISKLVASHGVKVVLNGLGGDELFAGYNAFKLAKKYTFLRMMLPFLKIVSVYHPRWRRALDLSYVKSNADLHGALLNNMSSFEKNKLFIDDSVKHLRSLEKLRALYLPEGTQFGDFIEAMSYMYMMNYIGNHHVYRVDQFTMQYSIEGRFPFLDHNVVETAFKIPSKYKLHGNTGKYVLREMAKNYIHPSCLSMKKKGFDLPMDFWIKDVLQDLVKDKLHALCKRDLFNPKAIMNVSKNFFKGRCDDYTLWQLVGIELWLEAFIDR